MYFCWTFYFYQIPWLIWGICCPWSHALVWNTFLRVAAWFLHLFFFLAAAWLNFQIPAIKLTTMGDNCSHFVSLYENVFMLQHGLDDCEDICGNVRQCFLSNESILGCPLRTMSEICFVMEKNTLFDGWRYMFDVSRVQKQESNLNIDNQFQTKFAGYGCPV